MLGIRQLARELRGQTSLFGWLVNWGGGIVAIGCGDIVRDALILAYLGSEGAAILSDYINPKKDNRFSIPVCTF